MPGYCPLLLYLIATEYVVGEISGLRRGRDVSSLFLVVTLHVYDGRPRVHSDYEPPCTCNPSNTLEWVAAQETAQSPINDIRLSQLYLRLYA